MTLQIPNPVPDATKAIVLYATAASTPPIIAVVLWIAFVAILVTIVVRASAGAAHAVIDVVERVQEVRARPPRREMARKRLTSHRDP